METKTTAKDFFLYLSSFAGLYVSAVSLISLLFAMINKALPDALNSYYYAADPYSAGVRAAIASLLIVFPLYLVIASYLDRYVRANPEKKELWVRKWLTYLTLFLTGVAVVVDLIVLVNTFLGGEITSRFIWKVLSVLVVSGAVFGYYFYDLRKSFAAGSPRHTKLIVSLACVLVFGSLVAGFVVVGSPSAARAQRFDDRRVNDLTSIQWQIVNYWQQKGRLPLTLDNLNDSISGFVLPNDPETGKEYLYAVNSLKSFKLCANFSHGSKDGLGAKGSVAAPTPVSATYPDNARWSHGAGEQCFDRTIDADLYPVREKAIPVAAPYPY